jgi:Rieske Fe-S protein
MMTVEWRGKPVWIINRTKEMLDSLKKPRAKSATRPDKPMQPEYAKNETRSIKPEILVAVGICTHLGCSPSDKFKTGAERASRQLAGWLPVPLPRFHLRHGRPRVQEQAGAGQPRDPAAQVPGDTKIDRRRRKGINDDHQTLKR